MNWKVVSTVRPLKDFLDKVESYQGLPPSLYVDLEGENLSRHGTIAIVSILLEPEDKVYLIDVTMLGKAAFLTVGSKGRSLKDILESEDFIKVIFDVRSDSDALYNLYQVNLRGVEDLQLMELATRTWSRYRLKSLFNCIREDAGLTMAEWIAWSRVKNNGKHLFAPELGGSYSVFAKRPLSKPVLKYCCQDVELMPRLRERYLGQLCDGWWQKIIETTKARVEEARQPDSSFRDEMYADNEDRRVNPKALGPSDWQYWRPEGEQKLRKLLPESQSRRITASRLSELLATREEVTTGPVADGNTSTTQTVLESSSADSKVMAEDDEEGWIVVQRRRNWGSQWAW
ncbi:hypothetical protein AMS68_002968 [Peltaster fructicola]|uniref:3'-5' exonuclease domain-containing protein n=1 Tax=Peltaster fructicola TaxID=286661 RepID=A0A6H0XS18_9PEZI|nr:hypothetical protein AMS68_002968 [Peltaster fructicola]